MLDYLKEYNVRLLDYEETENGRYYEIDNGEEKKYFPSVTSITSSTIPKGKGYAKWIAKYDTYGDAMDYANKRANIGTKVHGLCEEIMEGEQIEKEDLRSEVKGMVESYEDFIDKKDPSPVALEFPVFSEEHRYAGTADLLVKNKEDNLILLDIKTSKYVFDSHKAQLHLYRDALDELGVEVDYMGVVKLSADDYEVRNIEYCPYLTKNLVGFYDWIDREEVELTSPG